MSFLPSVKAIGENAVASMKRSVQHLQATPESIYCPTCAVNVPVPSHVFEWKCQSGHSNARDLKFCSHPECTLPRPSTLPTPMMSCSTCNTHLTIPTNNLTLHLSNAARTTTEITKNAVEVTKQQITYLRAIPNQFHCNHCDSLLAVPTGPWACQTCTAMNDESILKCRSCQQPKTEQKAICGVCRQSTKIPSSNLLDTLSHTVRDVHKSSQKIYYDLSGKPYVSCPRCNAHIKIVKRSSPASIELEHKEGVPSSSSDIPPRPSSTSEPGSTDDTQPSHDHIVDVVCPACHNAVDLD